MLVRLLLDAGGSSPSVSDPLFEWLKNNASAVGLLAFLVVAMMRGWLVTGREANQLRTERDRAIDLVYKQADIANRALEVGEKKGT